MCDAITIASSCPLPSAVADSSGKHTVSRSTGLLRSEHLQDPTTNVQFAPYQAVPVCGIITQHQAVGLRISEIDERSDEVGDGVSRRFAVL